MSSGEHGLPLRVASAATTTRSRGDRVTGGSPTRSGPNARMRTGSSVEPLSLVVNALDTRVLPLRQVCPPDRYRTGTSFGHRRGRSGQVGRPPKETPWTSFVTPRPSQPVPGESPRPARSTGAAHTLSL